VRPVRFKEQAASREIDDCQAWVEGEGLIVVGLRVVPFLVGTMQFAALEIKLRVLRVFRDLFRDGSNLFVQIAVSEEAQREDGDGHDRNGDDP
jgi:hypothetical protein